jgi:hypothetical protein
MQKLIGKTVAQVQYENSYEGGVHLVFTDGTTLNVSERMQAGEIRVFLNGEEIPSDQDRERGFE